MRPKFALATSFLLLCLLFSATLQAQLATLSGTVSTSSRAALQDAKVSAKNVASGATSEARTDSSGHYSFSNLAPGDYEVSVSAAGFDTKVSRVTLTAGAAETANAALTPSLSLQSLGFPTTATKGNPQEQARLDKRTHMLKIHQRLGLITAAPMIATVIIGTQAGGRQTSTGARNAHLALGTATAGLYFTSASFAIFAPKVSGTRTRGPIRLHKALAWIHGPGMVLTPILGAMAYSQKSNGQRVHGIASAHGPVGIVTAAAFGAALLSVSVKF